MPAEEQKELEKDLIVWSAGARPFKRRNRQFWVTVVAMAAVIGLVLFLVEGFMPVILIISVVFLFYVLSTVEPENIEYKITTKGIKIAGHRTGWEEMGRFWFTRRFDSDILVIETGSLPGRIEVIIKSEEKDQLKTVIKEYLEYEDVPGSGIDRAANWVSKRMPGGK